MTRAWCCLAGPWCWPRSSLSPQLCTDAVAFMVHGQNWTLIQFHFLLLRCVFQLVKICLFLASHIVSAPQSLSHGQPVSMLSLSSVMLP